MEDLHNEHLGKTCDLCGETCEANQELNLLGCSFQACTNVYHQDCLERYLKSIRCERCVPRARRNARSRPCAPRGGAAAPRNPAAAARVACVALSRLLLRARGAWPACCACRCSPRSRESEQTLALRPVALLSRRASLLAFVPARRFQTAPSGC